MIDDGMPALLEADVLHFPMGKHRRELPEDARPDLRMFVGLFETSDTRTVDERRSIEKWRASREPHQPHRLPAAPTGPCCFQKVCDRVPPRWQCKSWK